MMQDCQPLDEYKKTKFGSHSRKFKHSWFAIKAFSTWLEYSPSKDAAFFVYHAFSLTSQLGILGVMYSLRTNFGIGRKLMMEIIFLFESYGERT